MSSKHRKHSSKTEAAPQAASQEPTLPPIVDPPYQPSSVATNNYDIPVIDFKKFDPSIENEVKRDSLDSIGQFQESSALNAARVVLEVIDNRSFNEMNASTSPAVTDFLQFLRAKVPYKAMMTIAQTWPVAIPKPHIQMESFVHLLLRMANESSDPSKFIRWVCTNFPQHKWVKKSTSTNADLMAMGLAIVDGQGEKPLWVCLDTDSVLHVYRHNGEECEPIIEQKASRTRAGEDKKVIVDGISGEEICRFTPIDAKLSQPWAVSFDKKRASFPMYMTSYDTIIPPLVFKAYESAFTSVDGMMIRGISGSGVIADQHKLASSLFDIFARAQCVHQLVGILVGAYLDNTSLTVQSTIEDNSTLVSLFKVYVEKFGTKYVTDFLKKLVTYIDDAEELNIEKIENINMKAAEKVFFTTLKYILDSSSLFSDEIRHFASYIREYCSIRFNKVFFTYNNLADFIGIKFICGVLENPSKYIPGIQLKHPDNVRGICRLLRIAFKLGTMCGDFGKLNAWNNRLNKHVYPKLIEFIFSIADLNSKVVEYAVPNDEQYSESLDFLIKQLAEHHKPFMKELESVKKNPVVPGLLGYNFASAIAGYFVHVFDHKAEKKREEKKEPVVQQPEYSYDDSDKDEKPKEEPKKEEASESSSSSSSKKSGAEKPKEEEEKPKEEEEKPKDEKKPAEEEKPKEEGKPAEEPKEETKSDSSSAAVPLSSDA